MRICHCFTRASNESQTTDIHFHFLRHLKQLWVL